MTDIRPVTKPAPNATAEADRMVADALDKRIEGSGKAVNPGPDDDDGTAGALARTG
jgi:hypothetical protein